MLPCRTTWNALWHAAMPCFFILIGPSLLVLVVRGLLTGMTLWKGEAVNRAKTPFAFWFFIVIASVLGHRIYSSWYCAAQVKPLNWRLP